MTRRKAQLVCENVGPGMFTDELAVELARSDGSLASYLVPANVVRENRLSVEVIDQDSISMVTVPTPQPTVIAVDRNKIIG